MKIFRRIASVFLRRPVPPAPPPVPRRAAAAPTVAATLVLALAAALLCSGCPRRAGNAPADGSPPDPENTAPVERVPFPATPRPPLRLTPTARLSALVPECSGLAPSRRRAGVFWTHGDSGNPAVLFAVRADGSLVRPRGAGANWRGLPVRGAKNTDWEAVATDGAGRLVIGDIGNNHSARRDLSLLVLDEPDPLAAAAPVAPLRKIRVRHAAQKKIPDSPKRRFDCESLFFWDGAAHVFTKRWSDTWTVLCRLRLERPDAGVFEPVATFDAGGMVTDAAVSPDGRFLGVLTYHRLWVFALPETRAGNAAGDAPNAKNAKRADWLAPQKITAAGTATGTVKSAAPAFPSPLTGAVWTRRLRFPDDNFQAEGLAFLDNDTLLIGTEQGGLFRVPRADLDRAR
ncbi:MAG: hypothetical protein LBR07_07890 [Puniceicoccales bacterium]|jgi:hypothetical protein|nr:hypothetical protein [Puniceicoccales bacterium]